MFSQRIKVRRVKISQSPEVETLRGNNSEKMKSSIRILKMRKLAAGFLLAGLLLMSAVSQPSQL